MFVPNFMAVNPIAAKMIHKCQPHCEAIAVTKITTICLLGTINICFRADIFRTNTGVTNTWLHYIKCHSKPGQWVSMHGTRALEQAHLTTWWVSWWWWWGEIDDIKDELKCLFPDRPLPCCDVFVIQTMKQPIKRLIEAGHKLGESVWSVLGKFNQWSNQ